jgi:hypothetical protein
MFTGIGAAQMRVPDIHRLAGAQLHDGNTLRTINNQSEWPWAAHTQRLRLHRASNPVR